MALLELKNVSMVYNGKVRALDGINFSVEKGEWVTGNLDEANQNLVMKIFHELHAEGHTIITVTHSPDVGREAQRCITLEHGRIKQ